MDKKERQLVDADQYAGQWVALHPATDEVLGHDASLPAAENQAIGQGVEPVLEFIPSSDGYFAGQL